MNRSRWAAQGRRRVFTGLSGAVASALVTLTAGCAQSTAPSTSSTSLAASLTATPPHTSSPGGAIHFPATLFGFHQNTGSEAQKVDQGIVRMFAIMRMFTHPQVVLYGSMATGDMFIVGVTDLTAVAKKYGEKPSAASIRRSFLMQGVQDGRPFPAGAPGAVLGCGHMRRAGPSEIICARYDKKIMALVVYFNASASSLSDAASRTSRAISAIAG